jgi:large subunit ribosomal protein L13
MKTYTAKASEVERRWHVIDASGQTLGRLASEAAQLLKGKHKPQYTPHLDTGDFVIVVNAAKIRLTGKKVTQRTYYRHSGYPGGLKAVTMGKVLQVRPTRVVERALRGMLPSNRLGEAMYRKLKVYAGETHPHAAQIQAQVKQEKKMTQQGTPGAEGSATVPGKEA